MNATPIKRELDGFVSFLSKGDVLDLSIGVIIGGSFSSIVDSLVKDVLSPLLDLITPSSLETAYITLRKGAHAPYDKREDAIKDGAVVVSYGMLLQNCLSFLIKGLCLYAIVRLVAKARGK